MRVISRTSNEDLQNLYTESSAAWEIQVTKVIKNGQIMTNNKHFTEENVLPPYPSAIIAHVGEMTYCLLN